MFYGDGKTMYQQSIVGAGSSTGGGYSWTVWSPRVKGIAHAMVELDPKGLSSQLQPQGAARADELNADEAKTLLAHATFFRRCGSARATSSRATTTGVYYFVDELARGVRRQRLPRVRRPEGRDEGARR